jgi:hypothetical protein
MGFGSIPATWAAAYSASATTGPLLDAIGFEIDVDGKMYPVVYASGVRVRPALSFGGTDLNTGNGTTSTGGLRSLADGSTHEFAVIVRADIMFWYIDSLDVPVASYRYSTAGFTPPSVQTLPLRYHSINATTAPGTAPALAVGAIGVADTGHNGAIINDATYPWRRAQVGKAGGLSVKGAAITTTPVAFAQATTGTVGPIDVSEAGNATFVVKNTAAATAWTGAPVLVFEQSDDNVSWTPLVTVRSDTAAAQSTHVLGVLAANTSIMFDAGLEGVSYVRARLTTGTTTGGLTVAVLAGGMPFSPVVAVAQPARTTVVLYGTALAVGATTVEAMLTVAQQKGVAAVNSSTSFIIPNGKRFRMQAIVLAQVGNATATLASTIIRMRYNATGAAVVGSTPILWQSRIVTPASASAYVATDVSIPDGLELTGDGVGQYGFSVNSTYTTNAPTVDLMITGYEY